MSHVDGLGGAFIFSQDPERLARWYERTLGLSFERAGEGGAFYIVFWAADPADPSRRLDTTFAIMRSRMPHAPSDPGAMSMDADQGGDADRGGDSDQGGDEESESMYGDQPFMVNLRVGDLDALVEELEAKGIGVLKREDFDYGRFAWIRDADGSRVELYQPMGG